MWVFSEVIEREEVVDELAVQEVVRLVNRA